RSSQKLAGCPSGQLPEGSTAAVAASAVTLMVADGLEPPASSPSDCLGGPPAAPGQVSIGTAGDPSEVVIPVGPTGGSGGGVEIMDGATVPVAVVASRTEAELIVGMLRNNGLRAAVAADDAGGQEPQLQLQGVRVLVAPADEDAARQLIAAANDASSS